jgi:N,N-dimethylformamidase
MNNIPLVGYSDRLSARPGDEISFKVSSNVKSPISAKLFRSISADPNPNGPGIVEHDASEYFPSTSLVSKDQPFYPGSYGLTVDQLSAEPKTIITLSAVVYPTLAGEHEQTILALGNVEICIDESGCAALKVGNFRVSVSTAMNFKHWYRVNASVGVDGKLSILQEPLGYHFAAPVQATLENTSGGIFSGHVSIAARLTDKIASNYFNGKIEAPQITVDGEVLASWDLSEEISTQNVKALFGPDMVLKNFPTRAVTSSEWDGSEMCWRHKPAHYAAIHFHEDDIYDFEWETSLTFKIPPIMLSGIYVMRIECDGNQDAMPFYVCPPLGQRSAKLCVLIPTFTYAVYGNHARPDYVSSWQQRIKEWGAYPYNPAEYPHYGLSTYNCHLDGSGICHASHRRPLLNLRPGYITFGDTPCSGLRHFQADSHLISWLHAKNIEYDVITDTELQHDGLKAIEGYEAVITATHPEYHTEQTLDALRDYRDNGGALHYLGGNGFYWRVARHVENDSLLEIRRAEGGIRAWEAEPGEYYNAFDGTYGGLWRRNGRTPQSLVGVGFTAQGEFFGSSYQRKCYAPEFDWVFKGVEGDVLGDFGLSGNGAAGFELDHLDKNLGSLTETTLLAQSGIQRSEFVLVPEEQLTHMSTLHGRANEDVLTADMIYFKVPGGGTVFSVGSITFCGSLPWNNYDNNISRLLENVLSKSIKS